MTPRGLFVTGTDTAVGKTVVTAALAAALRMRGIDCGVMKPAQTGDAQLAGVGNDHPLTDAEYLIRVSGVADDIALCCPVRLREPVAPSVAAREEGAVIDIDAIKSAYRELARRHEFMLVEGAGGIAVPLTDEYCMVDLARDLGLPLLIVARPSLGTINHTVLTVKYAEAAGLVVAGVVINGCPPNPSLAERTNPAEIERHAGVPVLAILPRNDKVDVERGEPGDSVAATAERGLVDAVIAFAGIAQPAVNP